jgi:hypothetical protein
MFIARSLFNTRDSIKTPYSVYANRFVRRPPQLITIQLIHEVIWESANIPFYLFV